MVAEQPSRTFSISHRNASTANLDHRAPLTEPCCRHPGHGRGIQHRECLVVEFYTLYRMAPWVGIGFRHPAQVSLSIARSLESALRRQSARRFDRRRAERSREAAPSSSRRRSLRVSCVSCGALSPYCPDGGARASGQGRSRRLRRLTRRVLARTTFDARARLTGVGQGGERASRVRVVGDPRESGPVSAGAF